MPGVAPDRKNSRRQFLTAAAGTAAGVALWRAGLDAAFAQPAADGIAVNRLGERMAVVTGAGGNVVVLDAPGGLVLVDSGAAEHAERFLGVVRDEFGSDAIAALFNTHWHLDHTGGNDLIGARAGRIIANENTRLWMSTEFHVRWQDRTYTPRAPSAQPNDTFYFSDPQPVAVDFGGVPVEYAHLPEAHTDGDIYVWFPQDDVLVAGDAVAVGVYPVPDYTTGGWVGGLVDATERLLEIAGPATRIVPGKGPVVGRAHLEAQLEMLRTVRQRMETSMRRGRSAQELLVDGVTAEFDQDWGDPERFVTNLYHGLWWVGRSGASF
jgi:cyclase